MKRRKHEYRTAEARAGHEYDISRKHREREAKGMRKYWEEKKDDDRDDDRKRGKYRQTEADIRHEREGMEGDDYSRHMAYAHHKYLADHHRKRKRRR